MAHTLATQPGSLGEVFALMSALPGFTALQDIVPLPTREARWTALTQLPFFSSLGKREQDAPVHLQQYRRTLELELLAMLQPHTLLYDALWFQMEMPTIRKVIRKHQKSLTSEGALAQLLETDAPAGNYIEQDILHAWSSFAQAKDTFELERVLDQIQLGRLMQSYHQSMPALQGYLELLVEHYNLLTIARLENFSLPRETWDAFLFVPSQVSSSVLAASECGSLEDILLYKKELFASLSLKPTSVLDLEQALQAELCAYVNQAIFYPDDEFVLLQYLKRLEYVFSNVQLLVFTRDEQSRGMLVPYEAL